MVPRVVNDLGPAVGIDQDVGRFYIPMDNTLVMRLMKSFAHLNTEFEDLLDSQLSA